MAMQTLATGPSLRLGGKVPAPRTALVGRSAEVARLVDLLESARWSR